VRVKTQQAKVEVDLEVDVRSDNYDQNALEALKIKKQVKAKTALDWYLRHSIQFRSCSFLELLAFH
jgi:Holliday junction resolvase-like predicted endonuclease